MADPFLREIKIFSFDFPPKGWAFAAGQLLPINQNQALFSLLGTTYGGNGSTNFALPNLQGRVPLHLSNNYPIGNLAGAEKVTLVQSQIPAHGHTVSASTGAATTPDPLNAYWANGNNPGYANSADGNLSPNATSLVGGSQQHDNMSPFLVLNFCIALVGIYPSQN